ncbi:ribonuclease 3-like protein 2 [Quercus suber]|uniref:Ribonuclease 3-like protein 2 n=1 Tax=Quercus suber TaxID=58331 RepID=A0AAW0KJT3_QUESU
MKDVAFEQLIVLSLVTWVGWEMGKTEKIVQEFVDAINEEDDISLAAAIYLDLNFDLQKLWVSFSIHINSSLVVLYLKIFRGLLEPIITPEVLQQPHPIMSLYQPCQKQKPWRDRAKNIAIIYVDGVFVASSSSNQIMDIAKLKATKQALLK